MILARKKHTVGDTRQYFVHYEDMIRTGYWLTAAVVTVDSANVTISGTEIIEGKTVAFLVAGGVLNETFTVTIVVTESNTEVTNDTVEFNVIAA